MSALEMPPDFNRDGAVRSERADKQRPRLIVADLDGTFLSPDRTISTINAAAAQLAALNGVPFVIATGRPSRSLNAHDGLYTLASLVIVSNGAAIYDTSKGAVIDTDPLTLQMASGAVDAIRSALPGVAFGIERGDSYSREPSAPSWDPGGAGGRVAPVDELLEDVRPILKMLAFHESLRSDVMAETVKEVAGTWLGITYSTVSHAGGLLEISAPGVSKASALAKLCRSMGIAREDVAAFGDMPNDLAMLEWVGMPFAMANSHCSLLDRGFTVIGTNSHSAVGHTIVNLLSPATEVGIQETDS